MALLGLAGCGGGSDATSAAGAGTSGSTTSIPTDTLQQGLISGSPAMTVAVGQAYAFRPTVSSTGTVTFKISGKPSWAAFNTTTGALSGTPTAADVGVNTGVQISANDGTSTSSLPAFEITVVPTATASTSGTTTGSSSGTTGTSGTSTAAATSSVTLSWTRPTTDTDGTALTNLVSYKVYYGTTSQKYTNTITVPNASELSYIVSSLSVGQTYYFAVTAVASTGVESSLSPEVSTTI